MDLLKYIYIYIACKKYFTSLVIRLEVSFPRVFIAPFIFLYLLLIFIYSRQEID